MKGTRRAHARTRPPAASTRLVVVKDRPWLELALNLERVPARNGTRSPGATPNASNHAPSGTLYSSQFIPLAAATKSQLPAAALQASNIPRIAHQQGHQESRTPSLPPCISPFLPSYQLQRDSDRPGFTDVIRPGKGFPLLLWGACGPLRFLQGGAL